MLVKFMSALSVVALLSSPAVAAGKKMSKKECEKHADTHSWNAKAKKCEAKAGAAKKDAGQAAPAEAAPAPAEGETAPMGE